jgi:hypothetical protein
LQQLNDLSQDIRTSSKYQENPYQIEYSLDFTSMYNAYQQYLSWVRQQEQIQRNASKKERLQQIEYQTQQKIAEYKITTDLYKARGGR